MGRELVNEFAWSSSRGKKLDDCARAYWWEYFGSWGGWERDAPERTRLAYRLKKLKDRWGWSGDIVHTAIRRALLEWRAGRDIDVEESIARTRGLMRTELLESRDGKRDAKNHRGFWGLLEHEYQEPVSDGQWAALWRRTEGSLRAFFDSRLPRYLRSLRPEQWVEIDEAGGSRSPPSFTFEGVKVYAAPDLAIRDEGGPLVFDWKTGRERPADGAQVALYALYLEANHKLPAEQTRTVAVYLQDEAREVMHTTSPEDIEGARRALRAGIARARTLLADPEKNEPLPMEAFPQKYDILEGCDRCPYRRLCWGG